MSFSFTASGTPREVIREVGVRAANEPQFSPEFGNAVNVQLGRLPGNAQVELRAEGNTSWGLAQTKGKLRLLVEIDVTAAEHPKALIEDVDPV